MKSIFATLCLLICCSSAFATDQKPKSVSHSGGGLHKATDKGTFGLDLVARDNELKNGSNVLDIMLRDKAGKGVEGAELTVTPWMPGMGHGVWEKTVVSERGGGKYHVENITIIRSGNWDIKVSVRKGKLEDRTSFPFIVADREPAPVKKYEKPKGNYKRSTASYKIPNVTLLNQDGKKVKLTSLVDSGKPVIVNFIFTTCTTICPVLSASFTNLRKELGENADKVQFISISIDPENDRPEQMKLYLSRFHAGKSWEFLTGSKDDIGRVLKAFDAYIVDKMNHEPIYLLHGPNSEEWVRIKGLVGKADLMYELRRIENK